MAEDKRNHPTGEEKGAGRKSVPLQKVRKTYGVRGLVEWSVMIPTGFAERPYQTVKFEGGQITGYGVTPARRTTDDPLEQMLIENSTWYRSGRIYKISEEAGPTPAPWSPTPALPQGGGGTETVKVKGNEEAKDYLSDNYGISKGTIRTKAEIAEAARKVGVVFEYN